MNTKCLLTSVATGRESLAGKRQTNSGQGSETRAAVYASHGLTEPERPAGGTAEVDRYAGVASTGPHSKVLLVHP